MRAGVCCQCCICETTLTDVLCSRCYILKCDSACAHPVFAPLTSLQVSLEAQLVKKSDSVWKWAKWAEVRRWGCRCEASRKGRCWEPLALTAAAVWASSPSMPCHKEVGIRQVIVTQRDRRADAAVKTRTSSASRRSEKPQRPPSMKWQAIVTSAEIKRLKIDQPSPTQWSNGWRKAQQRRKTNDLWVIPLFKQVTLKQNTRTKKVIDNVYNILWQNLYRES